MLKFSAPGLRNYRKSEKREKKTIKPFDIRDGTRFVQAHIQRTQFYFKHEHTKQDPLTAPFFPC